MGRTDTTEYGNWEEGYELGRRQGKLEERQRINEEIRKILES